jgi:predicted permease
VTINNQPVQVIGVLPASFDFASVFTPGASVDLFTPYALSERHNRNGNTLGVIGRLKPGTSIDQARSELVTLGKQLTDEFPQRNTIHPRIGSLDQHVNGRFRPALLVLAFAVAAVMLIVALNLASLQFARMTARGRELAVRLALGASRGQLIRQTLTESLVLATGGATIGIALGVFATRYVSRLRAFDIPLLARVTVDVPALAAATIVALVTGVVVGVLPALQAPADPNDALKESTRGTTRGGRHTRVRSALVVTEIAAALVLLVASSLLLRSFVRVIDTDLGFAPAQLARLRVDPATPPADVAAATAYYDEVLRRVRAIPGVTDASLNDMLPFAGDRSWGIPAEGREYKRDHYPQGFIRTIGDGYFRTMSISIRAGRDFTAADTRDAPPVVIINASMARELWPDRSPIGQRIRQGKSLLTVIGIVGDTRHTSLENAFTGEVYFPLTQNYTSGVDLVVRTSLPLSRLSASARAALEPIAPVAAKARWSMMQELIDKAVRGRATWRLRSVRGGARRTRDLRAHLVQRHATTSGNRHSHCARRIGERCARLGHTKHPEPRRGGNGARQRRRDARRSDDERAIVRGDVERSCELRWGACNLVGRRGYGGMAAGAPGVAGRSECRVACGVIQAAAFALSREREQGAFKARDRSSSSAL